MHDLAILKLKPRPLRLVYLASSRADLINAVTLYTHLWGGFANSIFPVPNDEELAFLGSALHSINPDYIFLPEQGLPDNVTELLNQFPIASLKLSSKQIENIANYKNDFSPSLPFENFNGFSWRKFPHYSRVSAGEPVTEYQQLEANKLVNQDLLQSWQQELYGHLNFEES